MYTVISLFAGCGGSSLGYKMAGFKELLAIDFNDNAIETFKLNFKDIPVWQKDIKQIKGNEILEFCNIKKGELDILDGSPPCQGFSTAGKRIVDDSRNDLFEEYKRLIHDLQPKVFIMENVSGMIKGKMKGWFIEIITELKKENYNVKCKLLNAKYYKVPQSRQRLIFIGIRKDLNLKPVYPKPFNRLITAKQAIKHLESIEYKEIIKFKGLKQGQSPYSFGAGFKRVFRNKPMYSISTLGGTMGGMLPIHYKFNRYLTIKELKILQSFPVEFKLTGKPRERIDRIGNSVPPKMMYYIAKTLKEQILDKYYNKGSN